MQYSSRLVLVPIHVALDQLMYMRVYHVSERYSTYLRGGVAGVNHADFVGVCMCVYS